MNYIKNYCTMNTVSVNSQCINVINVHLKTIETLKMHQCAVRGPMFCQVPVSLSHDVGSSFGLSLPSENSLSVAQNPGDLLFGHEVSKVPNHFPHNCSISSKLVKGFKIPPERS